MFALIYHADGSLCSKYSQDFNAVSKYGVGPNLPASNLALIQVAPVACANRLRIASFDPTSLPPIRPAGMWPASIQWKILETGMLSVLSSLI
jgi:hypothetical protein